MQGILNQQKSHQRTRGIACDSCFRKKIKCYRDSVPCEWCSRQSIQCTFDRAHRSSRAFSTGERVEVFSLEKHTSFRDEQISRNDINTSNCPSNKPRVAIDHILGHVPFHLRASTGLPFFAAESRQWMESRTGQTINFDRLNLADIRMQRELNHGLASNKNFFQHNKHPDLPDKQVVLSAFNKFVSSSIYHHFPFIHPTLFPFTLEAAYENRLSEFSPDLSSAMACVFAFVTFRDFMMEREYLHSRISTQMYMQEAQHLLSAIMYGQATLDAIQALLMIIICRLGKISAMNSVEPFFTTSIRFIFTLGGHLGLDVGKQATVFQVHCRSLFWIAYVMDNELCLRTCRPPMICTDYCDLMLPSEAEIVMEFCLPGLQYPSTQNLALFFPTDLRLALIQSRITKALYSPRAASKSDGELLKSIRELDNAVDDWYKNLQLPNDLSNFLEKGILSQEESNVLSFLLQIQHKYCIVALHQMATGCAAWMANPNNQALGINLSLEVAANASRTLLRQFLDIQPVIKQRGFWFEAFYVLAGVMNLFCQVLKEPMNSQTESDISLLDRISETFSVAVESHTSYDSPNDVLLMKEFVAEIGRLARCAILKQRGHLVVAVSALH